MFEMVALIILGLILTGLANMLTHPKPATAIIFVSIGLLIFSHGLRQYKDSWRVNHVYQQTNCTVIKKIIDSPHGVDQHATIIYSSQKNGKPLSYLVNNQSYEQSMKLNCVTSQEQEMNILNTYSVGQLLPCYYDPQNISNLLFSREETSIFTYVLIALGLFLSGWVAYHYYYPQIKIVNAKPTADKPIPGETAQTVLSLNTNKDGLTQIKNSFRYRPNKSSVEIKNPYVGLLFVLIISMVFFTITYYQLIEQWRIDHQFVQTTCTILDKKLNSFFSGKGSTSYSSTFYVSYTAGQQTYKQWVSAKLDSGSSSFYSLESGILDSYTKDQQYTCWYDPSVPSVAVLNRGYSLMLYILLFFDAVLVFLLVAAFKNIK